VRGGPDLGRLGEEEAARALKRKGYRILERNFSSSAGEIDIIARHRGVIVFVEVKSRASGRFGPPQAAVDSNKQRRLTRLAREWLTQKGLVGTPARFDVVSVRLEEAARLEVEVFENAFEAQD